MKGIYFKDTMCYQQLFLLYSKILKYPYFATYIHFLIFYYSQGQTAHNPDSDTTFHHI